MRAKKRIAVAFAASLTACNMEFAAEQTTPAPVFDPGDGKDTAKPELCKDQTSYNEAVELYQSHYQDLLSPSWSQWMIDNYDRFCRAFDTAHYYIMEKGKSVSLAVQYLNNNPPPYKKPWASEEEHMSDLERLLELTFPSWNFNLENEGKV